MSRICIVCEGYPTPDDPVFAFIQPVARGFADAGMECTVIAAQSLTKALMSKKQSRPEKWEDVTEKGNKVTILQPKYLSFSNRTPGLNTTMRKLASERAARKEHLQPDVVYGHFWHPAVSATQIFPDVPAVVANGESRITVQNRCKPAEIAEAKKHIRGVIAVSTKSLEESRSLGLLADTMKTVVLPNAVNEHEFYITDRRKAREELGIPMDAVIGCFVGSFIERKGVLRVAEAARSVPGLKLFLIGRGSQEIPESEQILFKGSLPHEKIVTYLNAADFFVLPTLAEGCCNAVVEALACGLPVISSDRDFNHDILNAENAILIDPSNVGELAEAMKRMTSEPALRERLSAGAARSAASLKIDARVSHVISFIKEACGLR